MKPTPTPATKRNVGITLLELTVVILVLLSLVTILFIGARAWKKGSDRSANILNIRNVQQAMRSHANLRGLSDGAVLSSSAIVGAGKYLENVKAPNTDITYAYGTTVPTIGTLYLTATYASGTSIDFEPTASTYAGW